MSSSPQPRDRDMEAMMRRCKPLKVGFTLILLMNMAVTFQLSLRPARSPAMQLFVLASLYVASILTVMMMFSMCETGSQNAAWLTVLLSPLVIGLFAMQIETILLLMLG